MTQKNTIEKHARRNHRVMLALRLLEREPALRVAMTQVAAQHGLKRDDVLPASRRGVVTDIMHEFFYRALTETSASTVLIGDISARNHSTVLYGAARWAMLHELPIPRGAAGGRYVRIFHQRKGAAHGEKE